VSFAHAAILLFNVIAVIAYPVIGHAAGLSEHALGLFAETAINNTPSVIAATHVYGHHAAAYGPERSKSSYAHDVSQLGGGHLGSGPDFTSRVREKPSSDIGIRPPPDVWVMWR
jgi:hypothetical protein